MFEYDQADPLRMQRLENDRGKPLHRLFGLPGESWGKEAYVEEYAAIGLTDGVPYIVRRELKYGEPEYDDWFILRPKIVRYRLSRAVITKRISYEELRDLADRAGKTDAVQGMDAQNWREFIPGEKLEKASRKPLPYRADKAYRGYSGAGRPDRIHIRIDDYYACHVVLLRRVGAGYRLFCATVWRDGPWLRPYETEEQIRDLIVKGCDGVILDACDRKLSSQELDYIRWQIEKWDTDRKLGEDIDVTGSDRSMSKDLLDIRYMLERIAVGGLALWKPSAVIPDHAMQIYEGGVGRVVLLADRRDLVIRLYSDACIREAWLPFDQVFDWYLSQLYAFVEEKFAVKLERQGKIREDEFRKWILDHAVLRIPAYRWRFREIPDRYRAYREFSLGTEVLLVLQSQQHERSHYIAVGKDSGKVYEVYSKVVGVSGQILVEDFQHPPREISFSEAVRIAEHWYPGIGAMYRGIGRRNWREYQNVGELWSKKEL